VRTSVQAVISHVRVFWAALEAGELSDTRALIGRNGMILLAKRHMPAHVLGHPVAGDPAGSDSFPVFAGSGHPITA